MCTDTKKHLKIKQTSHMYTVNPLNETHNTHSKQTNTNAHTKTHTTGLQQIKSA
jgi:hypothetical protein